MIKRYNTLSLVSGAAGCASMATGLVIAAIGTIPSDSSDPGHSGVIPQLVGVGLLLVGYVALMVVGIGFYAKAKGHSFSRSFLCIQAFGLLGLLYVVGLKDRSGDPWNT